MPRPHPTVRWRLTLLYGGLFLVCGAALLAVTYVLFAHFLYSYPPKSAVTNAVVSRLATAMSRLRPVELRRLLLESAIALGCMAVVSGALGWLVAGRVLAPLRTITATTARISETNLHERLAMPGPRDELRLLAGTIDRLLERLEAAFEAQRRFVANASHELRTPLAMMRTTLDVAIAKPGGVSAQTRELDAELRVDLDHAEALLESFLSLARAQNGRIDELHRVALASLVADALAARADRIAAQELAVDTYLEPIEVAGSAPLLARMVENVVENAVAHNQHGGSIEVRLSPSGGGRARLIVDSSGPLLDPAAVAQLAQPFRRLGRERIQSRHGHGLGLSIVAAVAAAHDGLLELHARQAGGLRVEIALPAAAIPQLEHATA